MQKCQQRRGWLLTHVSVGGSGVSGKEGLGGGGDGEGSGDGGRHSFDAGPLLAAAGKSLDSLPDGEVLSCYLAPIDGLYRKLAWR